MLNKTEYIRVDKTKNYTVIHNGYLKRNDISWKAKGIMTYILSLPDDWKINLNEVVRHATDGEKAFRSGWKELQDAGYIKRTAVKDEKTKKILYWQTIVTETVEESQIPKTDMVENHQVENHQVGNGKLQSTELLNTDKSNTNKLNSHDSANAKYADDSPYIILSEFLFDLIRKRNPKHKEPNWQNWADDFRKLHKVDGKELDETKKVLIWSQNDNFWKNNILSPAKFRKQYDQLYLKCNEKKSGRTEYNPDEAINAEIGF